jgi:beta-glucosidase
MPFHPSRRSLLRLVGTLLPAASPTISRALGPLNGSDGIRQFPSGFLWGTATAAYQVEGAVDQDGRGRSNWDTFSHAPGNTYNGDTGANADDHYHRFKEDIQLMKAIGLKAYRFSVAWPRVFPQGTGSVNSQGLDFYNRLVDELLLAGIEPFCTLFHWDLPQALEDKGGWQSRDTARGFADYAGYVAGKLSDRVKYFITMNEISQFIDGYKSSRHPPGIHLDEAHFAQVTHHAVLGHGLAVQAIRSLASPQTQIGLAENVVAVTPVVETPTHIGAARHAMREENARIMTVIQEGRYTDTYLRRLGSAAPKFTTEEMQTIGSRLDFMGLNIYAPSYVRASDSPKGYEMLPLPPSYPHMLSPWLNVGPEALYWVPKLANDLWQPRTIYITENGASSADALTVAGEVLDIDRVMFLRNYLMHLQRAVTTGVPVCGYFLWSLLDNYEWADGYGKRFGIYYVDFVTQKRTPKLSAEFYRGVIARNGIA